MSKQANFFCSRCRFYIRNVAQIRHWLDEKKMTTVHAYVTSRRDNGNSLLIGQPQLLLKLNELHPVQNAAAHLVTASGYREHVHQTSICFLHWLSVTSRIKFRILALTCQVMCGIRTAQDWVHVSGRTHTLIIDQREWFVRQTQICYLSQELTCVDTVIAHEWKCSKLPSFNQHSDWIANKNNNYIDIGIHDIGTNVWKYRWVFLKPQTECSEKLLFHHLQ